MHVARARTDSINIRESLGKTRAALWITDATFLYFSGCNAHPFHSLYPFLSLRRSLSFTHIIFVAFLPRFFSSSPVISSAIFLSLSLSLLLYLHTLCCRPSSVHRRLSLFSFPAFSRLVSTLHDSLSFSGIKEDSSLSDYPSLRIVTFPAEMETAPAFYSRLLLAKPSSRIIQ